MLMCDWIAPLVTSQIVTSHVSRSLNEVKRLMTVPCCLFDDADLQMVLRLTTLLRLVFRTIIVTTSLHVLRNTPCFRPGRPLTHAPEV